MLQIFSHHSNTPHSNLYTYSAKNALKNPILTNEHENLQELFFPMGDLDPIQYMVPWAYLTHHPKRHLSLQLAVFPEFTVCCKRTDGQTDH